jgi:hypothetical protein
MAMLQHAAGLAASPVVFYKLVVGGARRLPFLFSAHDLLVRPRDSAASCQGEHM